MWCGRHDLGCTALSASAEAWQGQSPSWPRSPISRASGMAPSLSAGPFVAHLSFVEQYDAGRPRSSQTATPAVHPTFGPMRLGTASFQAGWPPCGEPSGALHQSSVGRADRPPPPPSRRRCGRTRRGGSHSQPHWLPQAGSRWIGQWKTCSETIALAARGFGRGYRTLRPSEAPQRSGASKLSSRSVRS